MEDDVGQASGFAVGRAIGRGGTSLLSAAVILGVVCASASAAGDAERGHALAQTWCAKCHTIDRGATARDVAPSFPSIAERGRPDQIQARSFLNAPHPPMPDFNLSRVEIDDIVAYLAKLADEAPAAKRAP